jgi:hypothetical protein
MCDQSWILPVRGGDVWTQKGRTGLRGSGFPKRYLVGAFCETLFEAIHATFCIDQFCAARKERVAAGAGVNVHFFHGRFRFVLVTAGAVDDCFFIIWVNICSHV